MQPCQPEFLCTRYIVKDGKNRAMRISCYINITKNERQKAVLFLREKNRIRVKNYRNFWLVYTNSVIKIPFFNSKILYQIGYNTLVG